MGNLGPTALLFASLLAASLPAQQREPIVSTGARFTIEFLPGDLPDDVARTFSKLALDLVESAWPVWEKAVQPKDPAKATLRLHGAEASYRAIEKKLHPESFPYEVTVADDGSEAHVLLALVPLPALQLCGLPPTTRDALLFAAGKQLVLRQLGNRANDWLGDLIAIGLVEAVVNPQRRLGADLYHDARRARQVHAEMFASGTELLAVLGEVKSANNFDQMLAFHERMAMLAEQLAQRSPTWPQRLITAWPATPRNEAGSADRYAPIEALLGKDWKKTQERFEKSFKGAKLPWFVGGEVWRRGDDWVIAGTEQFFGRVFGHGQVPAGDWSLRATLEWDRIDPKWPPHVMLDWNGKDLLNVQFAPTETRIAVWDGGNRVVQSLGNLEPGLPAGKPLDFRVDVVGKKVTIAFDGEVAFERAMPARGLHGGFAFEVGASMLQVRGLKIEARPTKK